MGKACLNQEVHAITTFGDTQTVGNLCPDMEGLKTFLFSMETVMVEDHMIPGYAYTRLFTLGARSGVLVQYIANTW